MVINSPHFILMWYILLHFLDWMIHQYLAWTFQKKALSVGPNWVFFSIFYSSIIWLSWSLKYSISCLKQRYSSCIPKDGQVHIIQGQKRKELRPSSTLPCGYLKTNQIKLAGKMLTTETDLILHILANIPKACDTQMT